MRKRQNEMSSSSKNDEYLILGQNSDFRGKFGILELEMSHPDCKSYTYQSQQILLQLLDMKNKYFKDIHYLVCIHDILEITEK